MTKIPSAQPPVVSDVPRCAIDTNCRPGVAAGGSTRTPVIAGGLPSLPGVDGEVAAPAPQRQLDNFDESVGAMASTRAFAATLRQTSRGLAEVEKRALEAGG